MRQSRADPGDTVGSRAVPTVTYLRERRRTENFPVALRVLPRDLRTHLGRLYDVARVIDDAGSLTITPSSSLNSVAPYPNPADCR